MEEKNRENTCTNCRYFSKLKVPMHGWTERVRITQENHPTLSLQEAQTLAGNIDLFDKVERNVGKCTYKDLPELRDIELNGFEFGCIHFKK